MTRLLAALAVLVLVLAAGAAGADEEIQLYDRVYVKGNPDPIEGTIIEELPDGAIRFQRRGSTAPYQIAKSDIDRIVRADRPERVYLERAARVAADDAQGHLELARFCRKFSLLTHAETEGFKAARAAPKNVEAYRLLSLIVQARYSQVSPEVHADIRDRELEVYERAERAGVLPPDLRLEKARLLRDCGAKEAAIAELAKLEEILGSAPAGPTGSAAPAAAPAAAGVAAEPDPVALRKRTRLDHGDLALELGRAAEAERAFAALVAEDPLDVRALTGLGIASFARGDPVGAGVAFDRAVAAAPQSVEPLVLRAAAAVHAGDPKLAEECLEKAAAIAGGGVPGDAPDGAPAPPDGGMGASPPPPAAAAAPAPPEAALYGALAAALRGKVATARERISPLTVPAATPAGGASGAGSGLGEALLVEGFVLEIAGDVAGAIARYDLAALSDPVLAGLARVAKAQALGARGERPAAEEALKEAARLGHDFGEVAALLARSRREAGDFKSAMRFARYAADRRPTEADVLYGLGRSYLGAGQPDDAEAAFDAALAQDEGHVPALSGKAAVLYGRGDFKAAEDLFRQAVRADPSNVFAGLALRRLDEARARRLWRDDFARADAKDVRNRWVEDERFGVEAQVRKNRLVLAGKQASEDLGRTQVVREIEGARFAEFRARLDPVRATEGRMGIRLALRDAEVAFFRAGDGKLYYATRAQQKWSDPKEIGSWPAGATPREMWIALGGPARDEVIFGLDDQELARPKFPAFGRVTAFACAIYCQAPLGAEVEVACAEARVFVLRAEKAQKTGGY